MKQGAISCLPRISFSILAKTTTPSRPRNIKSYLPSYLSHLSHPWLLLLASIQISRGMRTLFLLFLHRRHQLVDLVVLHTEPDNEAVSTVGTSFSRRFWLCGTGISPSTTHVSLSLYHVQLSISLSLVRLACWPDNELLLSPSRVGDKAMMNPSQSDRQPPKSYQVPPFSYYHGLISLMYRSTVRCRPGLLAALFLHSQSSKQIPKSLD